MKKIFVIADHLWGTVTIRTVTDKDIVLDVIKRRLEDFVDNMDGFDREIEEIVNTVLHMETLPKYFFGVMKEHDNEYADAQSIFFKVENGRVTFKAEMRTILALRLRHTVFVSLWKRNKICTLVEIKECTHG